MKKTFLHSVCAAAMLAATPALAAAPTGGNSSTVTQVGDTEIAQVTQNGANDKSTVKQGYDINGNSVPTSNHNTATVKMTGNSGGQSGIIQSGDHNTATVTTTDDGSLYDVLTTPPGQNATKPITLSNVTQSGSTNTATVNQTSQFNADQSASDITQSASNNIAFVNQHDDSQQSTIVQTSSGNTANVIQGKDDGTGDATWGNRSIVNQMGGGGNHADVNQMGKIDNSTITQTGANGVATVTQRDASLILGSTTATASNNGSTINQSASNNNAVVLQVGERNTSGITESGNNNGANVDQQGNSNSSTITQNVGAGTVSYSGFEIGTPIAPAGGTNTSFDVVVQRGNFNGSAIGQTGLSRIAWRASRWPCGPAARSPRSSVGYLPFSLLMTSAVTAPASSPYFLRMEPYVPSCTMDSRAALTASRRPVLVLGTLIPSRATPSSNPASSNWAG